MERKGRRHRSANCTCWHWPVREISTFLGPLENADYFHRRISLRPAGWLLPASCAQILSKITPLISHAPTKPATMTATMMSSRMSAGVQCRAAARRQAPSTRIAAFNGVVSDRVAGVSGNSMFQVIFREISYYASRDSRLKNQVSESILGLHTSAQSWRTGLFGLID